MTSARRFAATVLVGACILSATSAIAYQSPKPVDPKTIAAEVDLHYNSLRTMKAAFTETYSGGGVSRTETGTLILKRPGKMRWDYAAPSSKLFVSDGKTAILYSPSEHQARRSPMKALDDLRSPLRYLLGHSQLKRELAQLRIATEAEPMQQGDVVLSGIPRHFSERIQRILVEINARRQIVRLDVEEVDGGSTSFQFRNLVENVPVADDLFRFHPPAGTDVIDSKDLQDQ